jgi:hypothetical protein
VVVPCVNADHPSVGATDPSGFEHETSIHVPACANGAAAIASASTTSATPVAPHNPFAFRRKRAEF